MMLIILMLDMTVCSFDLDLDLMTLIYELDLDIEERYLRTKMCSFHQLERAQDRQTDTQADKQTRPNTLPATFADGNQVCLCSIFPSLLRVCSM